MLVFVFDAPWSKSSEQGDGEVGEVVWLRTSLVSRLQAKGLICFLISLNFILFFSFFLDFAGVVAPSMGPVIMDH